MKAQIKSVKVTPEKLDKNGDIQKEEFATITLEVPIDNNEQYEALTQTVLLINKIEVDVTIKSTTL